LRSAFRLDVRTRCLLVTARPVPPGERGDTSGVQVRGSSVRAAPGDSPLAPVGRPKRQHRCPWAGPWSPAGAPSRPRRLGADTGGPSGREGANSMPTYLTPGVYVEEVQSGARPIEGVGTAVAAFVGFAEKGPFHAPTLVTSWDQYTQRFGG